MERALARWEAFLIFLGVLFYLVEFPHGIHGDASVRYDALLATLRSGHLAPMVYSYVHPLVSAPLLLLGAVYKDGFWWICRFNTFLVFLLAWALARSAKDWPGWDARRVRFLTLAILGATMFPKHATDYYAEVFCAVFAMLAILAFQAGRGWLAVLALCLSAWNAVATIGGAGLLLSFFAVRSRRWRYLAALPLLPAGFLAENWLKFGEAYPTAYLAMQNGPHSPLPYAMGPGFSYPLFFGLLNVLFSFGRGLVWFAPGLALLFHPALWREGTRDRETVRASLLYLAGLVFVYAKFWAWHGGAFWGPRYFVFASIPAALMLAMFSRDASPWWRALVAGAAFASSWVACQGVLFGSDFLEDCFRQGHELEYTCYYVPEYSVLWRFFIVAPPITGRRVAYLAYFALVAVTLAGPSVLFLARELRAFAARAWKSHGPSSGWKA